MSYLNVPPIFRLLARPACRALVQQGLENGISIGGALGLLHYLDYRPTHDVDAWWTDSATTEERQSVIELIETTLKPFGETRVRNWGDVTSVELSQKGRTVFAFQVAHRSVQLAPPVLAGWSPIWLDSLPDLVASKMVALVERGAPRDFRDVYAICQSGLMGPDACWDWWRKRQQLAGSDADPDRALLALETHLARIAQHRPLEGIADPEQRAGALALRQWFAEVFANAIKLD